MTPIRCEFYHSTGFVGESLWKPGAVLQFLYASGNPVAIVVADNLAEPRMVRLADIRMSLDGAHLVVGK